ncbi:uncharacterized protein [Lepeophtheirus salmonis]|uniref:uncharacterized protein n=1 Tax=Lepeophtheirus salmonis TaxID=72036 RepID=UPI001AE15CA6|nr:uncharacterized protein LOC121118940 [Lepeophtheirus salmonis]
MGLPSEISRALDNFTPLKRKALSVSASDDSNGKRFRNNNFKGDALDLDAFYSRLASFYPGIWNSFHPLSPLYAASWGWVCMGSDTKETLKCVSCTGFIITSLPKRSLPSVYYKAADILKNRISTSIEKGGGHEKFCPWLAANCPDIFQEIYLASQLLQPFTVLKEQFTKQWIVPFTEMFALEKVPYIPLLYRPQHSPKIYEIIKDKFPSLAYPEQRFLESVFILSLTGWCKKSNLVIQCKTCQRQCALWSFPSINDEVSLEKEKDDQKNLKEKRAEKNKDQLLITFNDNILPKGGGKRNIQDTGEVICKRSLTTHDTENQMEESNKSNDELNEEKEGENLDSDGVYEDEETKEDDIVNEEEEMQEEEDRDDESHDSTSISSDSDIIEIISSSEDEVLREDSDPEKPFLHLEEESSNSSRDSEINDEHEVSIEDSPSRPNSSCKGEVVEQRGDKDENFIESQSPSDPKKIEDSSDIVCKTVDDNTLVEISDSLSFNKRRVIKMPPLKVQIPYVKKRIKALNYLKKLIAKE